MESGTRFILLFLMSAGASEYQSVTAKVGEDVTLDVEDTHLQPEDDLIWSYGPNHTVFITFCNGDLQRIFPDRFQLDQRTGSLTIRSLKVEDARLYECVIINKHGPTWKFNLTVVAADPTSTPPGPPRDRTLWIVGVSGFIFICILLLFAGKPKERKEDPEGTEPDVEYTEVNICPDRRSQGGNLPDSPGPVDRSNLTTVYDKLEAHRIVPPDSDGNV